MGKYIVVAAMLTLAALGLGSQEQPQFVIRPLPAPETVLAVADFQPLGASGELSEALKTFNQVLWEDLRYSGFFKLASKSFYPVQTPTRPHEVDYAQWQVATIDADFLVIGSMRADGALYEVEAYVLDVKRRAQAFGRRVRGGAREAAHRLADAIVFNLTAGASRGIASTKIAFSRRERYGREIFLMDYDGHNQRPLTQYRSVSYLPDWSPDNSKLAFITRRFGGFPELTIVSTLDGTRLRFPNFNTLASSPSFSPDGSRIAFAMRNPSTGFTDIYVANLDGSNRINLTSSRSLNTSPTWSPSGRQIAFVSDRTGTPQLYIVDSDGANLRRVLSEKGFADSPDWSPDGRFIAFSWRPEKQPNFDIYLLEVASQRIFQLTSGSGSNESPSWAPDSRHLAFQSNRNGKFQIFTMFADGSEQRQLTSGAESTTPAWSKYYNAD